MASFPFGEREERSHLFRELLVQEEWVVLGRYIHVYGSLVTSYIAALLAAGDRNRGHSWPFIADYPGRLPLVGVLS